MESVTGILPVVLIIDDEEFYRNSITETLTKAGFDCRSAEDGEEGFQLYKKIMPDVIVLDRIMPRSGGTRFLGSVRDKPNSKEAFLVVYSSTIKTETVADNKDAFSQSGFSGILEIPKSVTPVDLADRILELSTAGNS